MTKTTVSCFGGKVLRCALAAATVVAFAPTVAFASGDGENSTSIVYKQSDGYEPYTGWQDGQWDEASDPLYASSGGTSRKGWPAWSLSDPLSIGVTECDSASASLITGSGVKVVTDTNACDTEGEATYADPWYYKNIILEPYDVTSNSTITFTFNTVSAGGANQDIERLLSLGGFAVTTSSISSTWTGDDSTVVWSATYSDIKVNQLRSGDNWWQRIEVTVPTENLQPDQTYYFVIKNGTAGGWARIYADIVFEFSTGSQTATWEGDLSAAAYGREQGNGGTKLGITSPDPSDVTVDLTKIDAAYYNTINSKTSLDNGAASFVVHADGSGSNWQKLETWTGTCADDINVYDSDPMAFGSFDVSKLTPVSSAASGTLSIELVNTDRDWPTRDGIRITAQGLEEGKTYYLVFSDSLRPATTNPIAKPVIFKFTTAGGSTGGSGSGDLDTAKEQASSELQALVDGCGLEAADRAVLQALVDECRADIESAPDADAVTAALAEGKAAVQAKIAALKAAQLDAAKESSAAELERLIAEAGGLTEAEKAIVQELAAEYVAKIEAATSTEELESILTDAKAAVNAKIAVLVAPADGDVVKIAKGTYTIYPSTGTATLKTSPTGLKAFTVPATISSDGTTYKVNAIGSKAFYKRTKLTKVVVGKNVATIGVSAFSGCGKLTAITLGAGVKTIKDNAFKGCKKLATATVKGKNLTKASVKNLLKGSAVKTVKVTLGSTKLNKQYVAKYGKWVHSYKKAATVK